MKEFDTGADTTDPTDGKPPIYAFDQRDQSRRDTIPHNMFLDHSKEMLARLGAKETDTANKVLPTVKLEDVTGWFDKNASKDDTNGDKALGYYECRAAINDHNVNASDKTYLNFVRNHFPFLASASNDKSDAMSREDLNVVTGWRGDLDKDLALLQKHAPGEYGALNFLRSNAKWIDADKDASITHAEVRKAFTAPNLSESQKNGLMMLEANFKQIAESTRMSRRMRMLDELMGNERPIGAREMASYLVQRIQSPTFGGPLFPNPITAIKKGNRYTALFDCAIR